MAAHESATCKSRRTLRKRARLLSIQVGLPLVQRGTWARTPGAQHRLCRNDVREERLAVSGVGAIHFSMANRVEAMQILVVEDDALISGIVYEALESAGYTVLGPVATVRDALLLAEAHGADLAVLNIDLAEGGSGIELAKELSTRWSIPSIFASGRSSDVENGGSGAVGFLTKPYKPSAVVHAVAYALNAVGRTDPGTAPEGYQALPP